jgi:nucleoredoxin
MMNMIAKETKISNIDNLAVNGNLLRYKENIEYEDISKTPIIMYYFSAHWCGPCKKFTPKLIELYNKWNLDEKQIEIIYCSLDKKNDEFDEYTKDMPWLIIPFGDYRIQNLIMKYEPEGIPSLYIIGSDEKLLSDNGYEDVILRKDKAILEWKKLYN